MCRLYNINGLGSQPSRYVVFKDTINSIGKGGMIALLSEPPPEGISITVYGKIRKGGQNWKGSEVMQL